MTTTDSEYAPDRLVTFEKTGGLIFAAACRAAPGDSVKGDPKFPSRQKIKISPDEPCQKIRGRLGTDFESVPNQASPRHPGK